MHWIFKFIYYWENMQAVLASIIYLWMTQDQSFAIFNMWWINYKPKLAQFSARQSIVLILFKSRRITKLFMYFHEFSMDIYFINRRLGLFIIHMKNVDCSKCRNSAPDSCTVMNLVDLAILYEKSALWGEISKLSKSNSLHVWLLLCCVCCNIGIKTISEIIQFSYSKAS